MSKRSLLAWVLGLCAVSACAPAVVLLPPSRAGFLEPVPAQLAPEAVAPTVAQVAPSAPGIGPANDPNAALDQAGGELDQGALPPDPEPNAKAGEPTPEADTDTDPQALRRFRSDLDPYGEWIDDARYGTVWVPYPNVVGVHFEPYLSGGHWSVSPSNQWLWVSDYPFGGVVFHYGRWVWISGEGWAWVAGNHYAPAWVHFWTTSDGYYGWAPLGPMHVWRAGAVVWITCPSPRPRVFIARRHIYAHTPSEHRVTNSRQLHELGQHARSSTLRAPAEASSQAVPSRWSHGGPRLRSSRRRARPRAATIAPRLWSQRLADAFSL
jgi:hypothetical protein